MPRGDADGSHTTVPVQSSTHAPPRSGNASSTLPSQSSSTALHTSTGSFAHCPHAFRLIKLLSPSLQSPAASSAPS